MKLRRSSRRPSRSTRPCSATARPRRSPFRIVPGDVVQLAAGDMIPGDVRVVQAKDLFVVQGSLTGESYPVEKFAVEKHVPAFGTGAAIEHPRARGAATDRRRQIFQGDRD